MSHITLEDGRYTITREWTGKEKPQFVVRFCSEWVDSKPTIGEAEARATEYHLERVG